MNVFIVVIEDGYIMTKFFHRTDWVKGVNQRSALHVAEMMMREQAMTKPESDVDEQSDVDNSSNYLSTLYHFYVI